MAPKLKCPVFDVSSLASDKWAYKNILMLQGKRYFGEYFWWLFPPPIYCWFIIEGKWSAQCKTTWTKEHLKQSGTNKIKFIYQEIHEKRNITNILI